MNIMWGQSLSISQGEKKFSPFQNISYLTHPSIHTWRYILNHGVSLLWFYVLSVISIHVSWSVFAVLFIVFAALPTNAYSNLGKIRENTFNAKLIELHTIQLSAKEYWNPGLMNFATNQITKESLENSYYLAFWFIQLSKSVQMFYTRLC